MPNKDLIYIGKRSKLLNLLYPSLPDGEIISFKNALNFHLENKLRGKKLILFSLPEEDNIKEYFSFIKEVNCKFLINISSTCIFADSYYKDKIFNKIPKYLFIKSKAHKLISSRKNSKNLVVGILNKKAPFPCYPFSKIELIANDLENLINNYDLIKSDDYYSFRLIKPELSKLKFIPYNFRLLIQGLDFGVPLLFDFIYKFLNLKARSYSCLSCFHFIDNLRIGDGTFGTAASSKNEIIFYSGRSNMESSKETLNTLIGYEKIGLDKYRHGVRTFYKNGYILKEWVFTPRIRKIFRKAYQYHVLNISWNEENQFFEIIVKNGAKKTKFFSKSLKLAAGTLENIRLTIGISKNFNFNEIKLSDHFITCIGQAKFAEILKNKYFLKTIFPFIYLRNNLIPIYYEEQILGFAEFRVDTKSNIKLFSLLKKLISYFFNRTGFLIFRPIFCEVWVQLLTEDMLRIELKDDLEKSILLINPIDQLINKTRNDLVESSKIQISKNLNTFRHQINPYLPSHHLWGGGEILENPIIDKLIKLEKLKICGSPSILKLGPFHHTIRNAKIIKSKSKSSKFSKKL